MYKERENEKERERERERRGREREKEGDGERALYLIKYYKILTSPYVPLFVNVYSEKPGKRKDERSLCELRKSGEGIDLRKG